VNVAWSGLRDGVFRTLQNPQAWGTMGLYIKYSSKRLSPWRFSFHKRHQDKILEMKKDIGELYLLLVCNDDGVVVLTFDELKQILNENYETVEWISATRNRRQMYSIKGSDGKLSFKVGRDEFLTKMFGPQKDLVVTA
jgi:hypothetical protein